MPKKDPISHYFEKIFPFKKSDNWVLPSDVYTASKWEIGALQELKTELNEVKGRLDKFDLKEWSSHTKNTDPSSLIIGFLRKNYKPELLTQAWCKFYEILSQFALVPKNIREYSSVHLCEAPGGFISALNHYLKINFEHLEWTWMANSLHPYYEGNTLSAMIPDDRLFRYTQEKWCFGLDGTGDVTKLYNYLNLIERQKDKVWLVTADGSINCMSDPGNQERFVDHLQYCETITALSLLKNGGHFVLKIFTSFEDTTVCLLYLLNCVFEKVSIFKPASSKGGNSEVYVICTNFFGISTLEKIFPQLLESFKTGKFKAGISMFNLDDIPKTFLDQIYKSAKFYKNKQTETVLNNINSFGNPELDLDTITYTKKRVAKFYLKKVGLKSIPFYQRLVSDDDLNSKVYCYTKLLFHIFPKYASQTLSSIDVNPSILSIKYGKQIKNVQYSNFCMNLESATKSINILRNESLFKKCVQYISKDFLIISPIDFSDQIQSLNTYNLLVYLLKKFSSEQDIFIFNLPLLTNVSVGIIFILLTSFKVLEINQTGALILRDIDKTKISNVQSCLECILEAYKHVPKNLPFDSDVIQIINPNLICHNDFFKIIWNYNNFVIHKLNCYNNT